MRLDQTPDAVKERIALLPEKTVADQAINHATYTVPSSGQTALEPERLSTSRRSGEAARHTVQASTASGSWRSCCLTASGLQDVEQGQIRSKVSGSWRCPGNVSHAASHH